MYTDIIHHYNRIIVVLPLEKYLQFNEILMPLCHFLTDTSKPIIKLIEYSHVLDAQFINDLYEYKEDLHIVLGSEILSHFPKYYVIYQFEQLVAKHDLTVKGLMHEFVLDNYFIILQNALEVWEYALNNIEFLKQKGKHINVKYVPFQYAPCMKYPSFKNEKEKEKDIDVAWIGANVKRRIPIIDSLKRTFEGTPGMTCVFGNNDIWNNDEPRIGPIINTKANLLGRTKIALNIHVYEPNVSSLEVVRILYFLANGCAVVSEPSGDTETDKLYQQLGVVFCQWEDMPKKCADLLLGV
jgi:hypothetical protein